VDYLSAMEAFVRVIDTGSFSGAARQLRLGQPAISKAIAQLEECLGGRLVLHSTHRLTPTESGQNFYEHARRAIEESVHSTVEYEPPLFKHSTKQSARAKAAVTIRLIGQMIQDRALEPQSGGRVFRPNKQRTQL
jgi:DNA-binding transcriptional LysR family regulator